MLFIGAVKVERFFQVLTQVLYGLVFVIVLIGAIRKPRKATIDIALLFGAVAFIVGLSELFVLIATPLPEAVSNLEACVLMAVPYLLLRLVADFMSVPRLIMRATE